MLMVNEKNENIEEAKLITEKVGGVFNTNTINKNRSDFSLQIKLPGQNTICFLNNTSVQIPYHQEIKLSDTEKVTLEWTGEKLSVVSESELDVKIDGFLETENVDFSFKGNLHLDAASEVRGRCNIFVDKVVLNNEISMAKTVDIKAKSVSLNSTITSGLTHISGESVQIAKNTKILSPIVKVECDTLKNEGVIKSKQGLNVEAKNIINKGGLSANIFVANVKEQFLNEEGKITAHTVSDIRADFLYNKGRISSANHNVIRVNTYKDAKNSALSSRKSLLVNAKKAEFTGETKAHNFTAVSDRLRLSTNIEAKKINIDTGHLSLHNNAKLVLPAMEPNEDDLDQPVRPHSLKVRESVVISKGSSLNLNQTQAEIQGDINIDGKFIANDSAVKNMGVTHVSETGSLDTSYCRWLGESVISSGCVVTQESSISVNGMSLEGGSAKFNYTDLEIANTFIQNKNTSVSYNKVDLKASDLAMNGETTVKESKIKVGRIYSEGKVDVNQSTIEIKTKGDFNKGSDIHFDDHTQLKANGKVIIDGDLVLEKESSLYVQDLIVGGRLGLDKSALKSIENLKVDASGLIDSRASAISAPSMNVNGQAKLDNSEINIDNLSVKGTVDVAKSTMSIVQNITLEKDSKFSLKDKSKLKAQNLITSGQIKTNLSTVDLANVDLKAGSFHADKSGLNIDRSLIQDQSASLVAASSTLNADKFILNGSSKISHSKLHSRDYFSVDKNGKFQADNALFDLNIAQWYGKSKFDQVKLSALQSVGRGEVVFDNSTLDIDDEFRTSKNSNLLLNNSQFRSRQAILSGQFNANNSRVESVNYDQRGHATLNNTRVNVKGSAFIDQSGSLQTNRSDFSTQGDFVAGCNIKLDNSRFSSSNYWQEGNALEAKKSVLSADDEIYFSDSSSGQFQRSQLSSLQLNSMGLFESELSKIESENAGFFNATTLDRSLLHNRQNVVVGPQSSVVLKNGTKITSRNVDHQGQALMVGGSAIDVINALEVRYRASINAQEASKVTSKKLSNHGRMQADQSQFVARNGVVNGRMNLSNHSEARIEKLQAAPGSQITSHDSALKGKHAELGGKVKIKNGTAQYDESISTGIGSEVKLDHTKVDTKVMTHAGDMKVKNGAEINAQKSFDTKVASHISGDHLNLNADDVMLYGDLEDFESVAVKSVNTSIYGTVSSDNLSVTADNSLFNQGFLYADRMNLDADFLTNQGLLSADSNLNITSLVTTNAFGGTLYSPNTTINALVYLNLGGVVSAYNLNKNTLIDLNYGLEIPSLASIDDILSPGKVWNVTKMAVKSISAPIGNLLDIGHRLYCLPGQVEGIVNQADAMYHGGQNNFRLRSALPLVLNTKNIAVSMANTATDFTEMASDAYHYANSDISMADVKDRVSENLTREGLSKAANFVATESVGILAPMVNQESLLSLNGGFVGSYNVSKSDYLGVNLGYEYAFNRLNHNSNIMFNGGRSQAQEVVYTANKFVNDGDVKASVRLKGDFHEAQLRKGSSFNTSGQVDLHVRSNLDIQGQAILGDKSKGVAGKIKVGDTLTVEGEDANFKVSGVETTTKKAKIGASANIAEGSVLDARETHIQRDGTLEVDSSSAHYSEKVYNEGANRNQGRLGDVVRDEKGKITSHIATKQYNNSADAWSLFRGEADIEQMTSAGYTTLMDQAKVDVQNFQQLPEGKTYLYDQSKLSGQHANLAGTTEVNDEAVFGMETTLIAEKSSFDVAKKATHLGKQTIVEKDAKYNVNGVAHGGYRQTEDGKVAVKAMEEVQLKEGAKAQIDGGMMSNKVQNAGEIQSAGGELYLGHLSQAEKGKLVLTEEARLKSRLIENAGEADLKNGMVHTDKVVQEKSGKTILEGQSAFFSQEAKLSGLTQAKDESTYAVAHTVLEEDGVLGIAKGATHMGKKTTVEHGAKYEAQGQVHGGIVQGKDGKPVIQKMEALSVKAGAQAQIDGVLMSEKLENGGDLKSQGGKIFADNLKQNKNAKLVLSQEAKVKSKIAENDGLIDANNSSLQNDELKQGASGQTQLRDNSTLISEQVESAGEIKAEKESTILAKKMNVNKGGRTVTDASSRDYGDERNIQGSYKNEGELGKLVTNDKGESVVVAMNEFNIEKEATAELDGSFKASKVKNGGELKSEGGKLVINELDNGPQSKIALQKQAVMATKTTDNKGQITSDASVVLAEKMTQSKGAGTDLQNGSFMKANAIDNDGTNTVEKSAVVSNSYNQGANGQTTLTDGSTLKGNQASIKGKLNVKNEGRFEMEEATIEKEGQGTFDETSLDLGKKRRIVGEYSSNGKAGQLVKDAEGKTRLQKMESFDVEGAAEINGVLKSNTLTNKGKMKGHGAYVETDRISSVNGSDANFKRSTVKSDTADIEGKFSAEESSQFSVGYTHIKKGGQLHIIDSSHEGNSADNDGLYHVKGRLEQGPQGTTVSASVNLKEKLHNRADADLDTAIVDTANLVSDGNTKSKDLHVKAKTVSVNDAWNYEGGLDFDVEDKFSTGQNSRMQGHGASKFDLKTKREDMQGHHAGDSMNFDIEEFDTDAEMEFELSLRRGIRHVRRNNAQELIRGNGRFSRIQMRNLGVKTKNNISMSGLNRGPGMSYDVEAASIDVNQKVDSTGLRLKSTQGDININADISAVKNQAGGNGSGNIYLESERNINIRGGDNKKQEPAPQSIFLKRFGIKVPEPQDLKPDEVSVQASGNFAARAKGGFHNKNAKINAGETASVSARSVKNERTHKEASAEITGRKVLVEATEGDVDNNGAFKATEFLGVQAKGNIRNTALKYTENGQYDTITRYDAAVMQGGVGSAETGGVGASISSEKQIYNEASKMTAIADLHVDGKEGVHSTAMYNTYVNDRWDNRSGIGGHKRNRGHSTHTDEYESKFQSENGKNSITSERGYIKSIGTQFLSPHGTQIVARDKVELLAAVYNDTRIERCSGGWGLKNDRHESHNEGAIPTVVATLDGTVYIRSFEDDVIAKGAEILGTSEANLVIKAKKDVVLSSEKLQHQVKTQSEGFSLDAPGLKLADGAQKGKIGDGLVDEDPLLSSIRSTAQSHNNVERGANVVNTAGEAATVYDQFKDGNPVNGAVNRYAKVSVSYSQEKSELNYETKGPGRINGFGHMHLESEEANVILGMDANVHNASVKAKKAFMQNATELHSSFQHEKNSVSVSMSATSGGPAYGGSHSHLKSKDKNYINNHLNVAGHLDVDAESWNMNGANTYAHTLGGEVKKYRMNDMMDTHEAKGESYSGSTDGTVGVGSTNENSKRVRQSSGLHVRDGINKEGGPQFKAGETEINGAGQITSDGINNYEKTNGPIKRTALEEHDKVESYSVSFNPGQLASRETAGGVTIGVQHRDYTATLDGRGRTVHNDEEYNFTMRIPVPKKESETEPKTPIQKKESNNMPVDEDQMDMVEHYEESGEKFKKRANDSDESEGNNNATYYADSDSHSSNNNATDNREDDFEDSSSNNNTPKEKKSKVVKVLRKIGEGTAKDIKRANEKKADDLAQNKTLRSKEAKKEAKVDARTKGDRMSKKDLREVSKDSNMRNRKEIDSAKNKAGKAGAVAKAIKHAGKVDDFVNKPVETLGKTIIEDGSKAAASGLQKAGGSVFPALGRGLGWFAAFPAKLAANMIFETDEIGPEKSPEMYYREKEAEARWRENRERDAIQDRYLSSQERVMKQFKLNEPVKQADGPTFKPAQGNEKPYETYYPSYGK